MRYETETNQIIYHNNLYPKNKPVFTIFVKLRSQIIALCEPEPCASKIVQINEIQKMKIVFNNFILIFCSWKRMIHDYK